MIRFGLGIFEALVKLVPKAHLFNLFRNDSNSFDIPFYNKRIFHRIWNAADSVLVKWISCAPGPWLADYQISKVR